ncbi:MAG: hypothetical protein JNK82_27215 [Myxococcaceae bacterium]|nr:hypothetical protein [Myxococcaceae bacterium]
MRRGLLALALALVGCPSIPPPPGDEQLGSFEFRAEPGSSSCPFSEIPDAGFTFTAAFSRFRDAGLYFVSIGGVPHEATFDGQRLSSTYTAQRNFAACSGCPGFDAGMPAIVTMTETLVVTIVSRSQSDALGGGCSESPPLDADAGIFAPATTPEGTFDAVRACGSLGEQVGIMPPVFGQSAKDTCRLECNGCTLSYSLTGERR